MTPSKAEGPHDRASEYIDSPLMTQRLDGRNALIVGGPSDFVTASPRHCITPSPPSPSSSITLFRDAPHTPRSNFLSYVTAPLTSGSYARARLWR